MKHYIIPIILGVALCFGLAAIVVIVATHPAASAVVPTPHSIPLPPQGAIYGD